MPTVRSDDVETGIGQAIQHLHVMPDCHVNARETSVIAASSTLSKCRHYARVANCAA